LVVGAGKLALFRRIAPTGGTGSLAGSCPFLSVRKLALFCRSSASQRLLWSLRGKLALFVQGVAADWLCLTLTTKVGFTRLG
jgi:hypothetical protein